MVKVTFWAANGDRFDVDAKPGLSLMRAAFDNCVPGIEAACGGSQVCGTCHAYVAEEWLSRLPAQSDIEREMLEYGVHVKSNSRLTCQIVVSEDMEGLVATMPPSQR